MLLSDLSEFEQLVLGALVAGYEARQGLKDRIRALNEWEIARRSGFTDISYAGYLDHPTREQVMGALSVLQRFGLISVWERGAQYDTFVPTAVGSQWASLDQTPELSILPEEGPELANGPVHATPIEPVIDRLDEIIRLLRSIDSKNGRA